MATRIVLATVAVIACAWFALGIRQAHDTAHAMALINSPGTPTEAQTRQILHLLDQAATLNPDRAVDLLRAQAEVRGGDGEAALRQMLKVVHDEPLNVDAWIVLGFAAGGRRDPAAAAIAHARELQLAPPVPAT
jgi:Flp pilus assembly protein TadD